MDGQQILTFLQENPEFFEQYADELAEIMLPHPYGGRAISLNERQVLALREKNKLLEDKLAELIRFGEENDVISDKVHRLAVALLATMNLGQAIQTIVENLRHDFAVPLVALRLWHPYIRVASAETAPVSHEIRSLASNLIEPYCGSFLAPEALAWLNPTAIIPTSFAQFALTDGEHAFGLLVMGSEDARRFYPEMGTLYLKQMAELVSTALLRHLETVA